MLWVLVTQQKRISVRSDVPLLLPPPPPLRVSRFFSFPFTLSSLAQLTLPEGSAHPHRHTHTHTTLLHCLSRVGTTNTCTRRIMTEKWLLLKCDYAGQYFIVGTDFPAARIFNTATSSLAAVVELPLRRRTVSLAALTLTSVAIRQVEEKEALASRREGGALAGDPREALLDKKVAIYYAAVGLSDGTVILHDVGRDVQLAHVQVSETQQPIISLQIDGGYAFCLAANHVLYVLPIQNAASGPCLRLCVQPHASSIAVTTLAAMDTATGTTASTASSATVPHRVFRVLVLGPTNALYEVRALVNNSSCNRSGAMAGPATTNTAVTPQMHATKLLAFPSQGTSAEFAWVSNVVPSAVSAGDGGGGVSDTPVSLPAITASAQDGVVRIWDVRYAPQTSSASASLLSTDVDNVAAASSTVVARCRRTLLCGQRILNVSVLPDTPNGSRKDNYVMVTTLTGSVLLWSLGDALLPPVVEPVPLKPDVVLVSAVAAGRLLFGALRPASGGPGHAAASDNPLHSIEMILLRGRFALPMFETKNVGDAVEEASRAAPAALSESVATTDAAVGSKKARAAKVNADNARRTALGALALGVAGTNASVATVVELPLNAMHASMLTDQRDAEYLLQHTTDAATSSFVVMDTVWAAHQHQVAAKASQYMTDAFKPLQLYHAKSIQELPVKQYTLEQRLQQVAREEAAAMLRRKQLTTGSAEDVEEESGTDDPLEERQRGNTKVSRSVVSHHALGLATVPLYQALHANDTSAVMDLLSISARSEEGMRATVLSLQLPYCLQLLHVISERLGMCSKAVEKVKPASQNDAGDCAESTIPYATAEQDGRTSSTLRDSDTADVAARSADAKGGSGSSAALRGGVAAFSIHSSLLEWIDAIVHYRGSELLAVQREWDTREAAGQASEATPPTLVSSPKDFLAPILHHYESLCSQYDKLAVLYGRLSIFKSVRPSEKNEFMNIPRKFLSSNVEMGRPAPTASGGLATSSGPSKRHLHLTGRSSVVDDDIFFPVMFKESRSRSGLRVVRVRSKLEIEKKRRQRESRGLALQKRARALAQEQLRSRKATHSILDDNTNRKRGGGLDVMDQIMMAEMEGKDGDMDLDALEAMDLADDASDMDILSDVSCDSEADEESEDYSEGETENATAARSKSKKTRREGAVSDAMLPDSREEESDNDGDDQDKDVDAALDSSEAEFSSNSDEDVDSDPLDSDDEESSTEDDDEEEEEEQESYDNEKMQTSEELDDDDKDSGMGEDMQDLLSRYEDNADRSERRKTKKVRTD
ncbi:hypothetical protein, conserved [Leishmania tarentolae]|uniref:Uncharacterized protein n=1 Tax=Leishmania tarentolae TaxID=5689 RepID=A0A640KJ23_LEITA|nr:hypothetical protein, conserved [Leishmania tarentolae]